MISNMHISPQGVQMVKGFETNGPPCLTHSECVGDVYTVGWGHTDGVGASTHITVQQAEDYLREDLLNAEAIIKRLVTVDLTQNQFDALVSFVFNLGKIGPTMLKKLNQKDYLGCAREFPRWIYFHGHQLDGLLNRRESEMKVFLTN